MKKRAAALFVLILLALSARSQTIDKRHLNFSASGRFVHVLDGWDIYKNVIGSTNYDMYDFKAGVSTRPEDGGWFERAFNYPGYGLGLSWQRMGSLRFKGDTHLGDIVNLYGWAEFDFVRTKHFRIGPVLELGLAVCPKIYHPVSSPDNLYLSSPVFALVGGGLNAEWLFAPQWSLVAGAFLTHHSNGMLSVPNYGFNELSFSAGVRYRMSPAVWETRRGPKPELPEYEKGLHWNFYASGGAHASSVELDAALAADLPPERWFPIPPRARIIAGAEGVWRYSPVFATGIGIDINYAENRYRETDLLLLGKEDPAGYSPLHCGIYLIQEFWYRRVSVHLNAGLHVFKKTGYTENMGLDYQRIGIRYHFRKPKGLFAGLSLRVHNFDRSYCQEWCLGYSL